MAANDQHVKNYQPAYDSLKRIVQSSVFYQNHIAHRNIGGMRNLLGSVVKSTQLCDFVENLRRVNTRHSFIPGLDKALTLIHETVDRIRNSVPHSAYTFRLMSDLPPNGALMPFTVYIAKEGNMLRYMVAHPSRASAGRIQGQIRVEPSLNLPDPLTLDALTEEIQEEILQITFERGDTVNDDKHLQRLIDILDCASDDSRNTQHLLPVLGYNSQGKAYDSIPRHDESVVLTAGEKDPEVPEAGFVGINPVPAKLSKVTLDGAEGSAEDGSVEGESALAGLIPRIITGRGILVDLMAVLAELGSDRDVLARRDFQNFKLLTPILKQFLLNIFEQVRHGSIPAGSEEDIRLLLEEVHALLLVSPQEGTIPDLNLPSLELSPENIIEVREWLRKPYTVVAPEGEEQVVEEGVVEDGGRFIIPQQDVNPLHGGIVHREGGDPIFRVANGTNDTGIIVPEVRNAALPAVATPPHSIASTTYIAGASSLWHGARVTDGYLRSRSDGYQHVSLPMMRLFATLRRFENDPVLAAAKVSGKTVWESLNPTEAGKFRVSSLVGSQANPHEGILDSAMEKHRHYQQQYTIPLAQVDGVYQPPGKRYHFKRTRSDLIQLIDAESLTAEELREATHELIVICQDVFDKIEINICVYDNAAFEESRGEELLKQVVMTTMSQGVNLLAADKAEERDRVIQQQACDLKAKMDTPQPEFQNLEIQPQRFIQADTTNWTTPKETVLRNEGIRVMTESGRVLPQIDLSIQDKETELRCEYWSTIGKWEKENDWRSIASATDIFLHVLEPLQTAPELYQKDGIYGHLTLLNERELKTFEECVEEQRQELDKWATVRQETLRRQRLQESQSVRRRNDKFTSSDDDDAGLRDSVEQQQSREYYGSDTESRRKYAADFAQQQSMRDSHAEAEEDFSDVEELALSEDDEESNGSDDALIREPIEERVRRSSTLTRRSLSFAQHKAEDATTSVTLSVKECEIETVSHEIETISPDTETVFLQSRSSVAKRQNRAATPPPRALRPSSSSSSSSIDIDEEIRHQSKMRDPIASASQNSIRTRRGEPKVVAKTIPGFNIEDVRDDGNCFYRAMVKQFEHLNVSQLRAVPSGEEAHVFFREEVEGPGHNQRWVKDADFDRIAEKLGIIIAVVNIEHHQGGFTCYLGYGDRAREPSELLLRADDRRPIIRLAYNGNHFMPVLGHPPLTEGALRSAYGTCATPHSRVDSIMQSDSAAFFHAAKTAPVSSAKKSVVSLSIGTQKKPIASAAEGESLTSASVYTNRT